MRRRAWVAVACGGFAAAAVVQQACVSNYCDGTGSRETCFLYAPNAVGEVVTADGGAPRDTGVRDVSLSDAADAYVPAQWEPGDGAPCTVDAGVFPSPVCDPSDETMCGADPACTISAKCGDPKTCEPFTINPQPGTDGGVDDFRMRAIMISAPGAIANMIIQYPVITNNVDLPSTPEACGEDGTGLFNWLLSVDKSKGTVTTGGAPMSADPVRTGYCYVSSTLSGKTVAPVTLPATFKGNTFSTTPYEKTLNIPIFVAGFAPIVLPIDGAAFQNVTVSADGNCIGSINPDSVMGSGTTCSDMNTLGPSSCARWHAAGSLGGYITLANADTVPITSIGGETLCAFLAPAADRIGTPAHCNAAGLQAGNYCSNPPGPATSSCHDSVWLAAEFAASAVIINDGKGNSVCGG